MWTWITKVFTGGGVVGQVADGINNHFEHKRKLKQTKLDSELKIVEAQTLAKIKHIESAQDFDQSWDLKAMDNQQDSWKDEFLLCLVSVPYVLAFCGTWGAETVANGLSVISTFPDWLVWSWGIMVSASFGFRQFGSKILNRKK